MGGSAEAGHPCGTLGRVLSRVYRERRPEILDLGPMSGATVMYLAGRGARVHVDEFAPPPPTPERKPGQPPVEIVPVRLDQPDAFHHLVLAWDWIDFMPPERLQDFGAEMRRILREAGWLFLFSHARPPEGAGRPSRYRLLADDLIVREQARGPRRRRWVHPNRDIERAFAGFEVQALHLQRDQTREFLLLKTGLGG
jgi:hypothetical protein